MGWLYGHTGFSFIDVWALVHLTFWIFFGSCLWAGLRQKGREARIVALTACMVLAYGWEMSEAVFAPQYHGLWGDWFLYDGAHYEFACVSWLPICHYESWWNSWISDPLTCLIGVPLIWFLLDRKPQ